MPAKPADQSTWLTEATSCRITTIGRRSGDPHVVAVWFAAVPAESDDQATGNDSSSGAMTVYAISREGLAGDWVQNLLAEPAVTISNRSHRRAGRARVVDDPAEHELARQTMYAKYSPRHRGMEVWLTADAATVVAVELPP